MTDSLLFLALLLPPPLAAQVLTLQQEMAERFQSRAALRSPPHITLYPPFRLALAHRDTLILRLRRFAQGQRSVAVQLKDFSTFKPRVIFVQVENTAPLFDLQHALQQQLRNQLGLCNQRPARPFHPHITLAYRDLRRDRFQAAWLEFQARTFQAQFVATELTLLEQDCNRWQVDQQFALGPSSQV